MELSVKELEHLKKTKATNLRILKSDTIKLRWKKEEEKSTLEETENILKPNSAAEI